jgi:hypothetical protein
MQRPHWLCSCSIYLFAMQVSVLCIRAVDAVQQATLKHGETNVF